MPSPASQILTSPYALLARKPGLPGCHTTSQTGRVWPMSAAWAGEAEDGLQVLTIPSQLPEARTPPRGSQARESTLVL